MKQVIKLVRTPEISNVRAVIAKNTVEDELTDSACDSNWCGGGYTSMVQNLSLSNLREMVMDVLPSE
jgi:hypothetical protein